MVHKVTLGQASSRARSSYPISNISTLFRTHFRLKTTPVTTTERNHGTIKKDNGPSKIGKRCIEKYFCFRISEHYSSAHVADYCSGDALDCVHAY